jgi:hypothetical protein
MILTNPGWIWEKEALSYVMDDGSEHISILRLPFDYSRQNLDHGRKKYRSQI